MGELGATAAVLPELEALRGVEQSRYHHRDVYGHTLEVLERTIALEAAGRRCSSRSGARRARAELAALLAEPLADELTRGEALRWGALLHDAAKPLRARCAADGRVTFFGHDERGAELARERARAAAGQRAAARARRGAGAPPPAPRLPRARAPAARARTVFDYLRACEPVEVDVTLLSVADRLATRGDRAQEAIDAHLRVARGQCSATRCAGARKGAPRAALRGDELARRARHRPGPAGGASCWRQLAEAQYAGEISTREQALAYARGVWLRGERSQ